MGSGGIAEIYLARGHSGSPGVYRGNQCHFAARVHRRTGCNDGAARGHGEGRCGRDGGRPRRRSRSTNGQNDGRKYPSKTMPTHLLSIPAMPSYPLPSPLPLTCATQQWHFCGIAWRKDFKRRAVEEIQISEKEDLWSRRFVVKKICGRFEEKTGKKTGEKKQVTGRFPKCSWLIGDRPVCHLSLSSLFGAVTMHCYAGNIERLTCISELRTDLQSRFLSSCPHI